MQQSEVIAKIKPPFRYLFDRYQYRVIGCRLFANSSNWIVVLESPSCGRFLVFQDRGEIIVALGPHGSPESATDGRWFDLAVIVEHLSQGQHMLEPIAGDPDQQMERLADILRPYMPQICPLWTDVVFGAAESELDRIGTRREAEIRAQDSHQWGNGSPSDQGFLSGDGDGRRN
jgi:hypothetical protein